MSPKQLRFFKKTASLNNTLLLASLLMIMLFFIVPNANRHIQASGQGIKLIDALLFYTPSQVHEIINAIDAKGRQEYIIVELTADLYFSIVLAAFFGSFLIYSSSKTSNGTIKSQYFLLLPFVIIVSNFLENSGIVWMLINNQQEYFYLAIITYFFTLSKWMSIFSCCALALWNSFQRLAQICFE